MLFITFTCFSNTLKSHKQVVSCDVSNSLCEAQCFSVLKLELVAQIFALKAVFVKDLTEVLFKSDLGMEPLMRVCFPFVFKFALELHGNRFEGFYAKPFNEIISYIGHGHNISATIRAKDDGIGEMDQLTGNFDGCIGRLQRNQSDMMFQFVDYPFNAAGLQQGDVFFDTVVRVLSFYRPRTVNEKDSLKIENCFKSFDWKIWICCFLTTLILYVLLIVRRKIYHRAKYDVKRPKLTTKKDGFTKRVTEIHQISQNVAKTRMSRRVNVS